MNYLRFRDGWYGILPYKNKKKYICKIIFIITIINTKGTLDD